MSETVLIAGASGLLGRSLLVRPATSGYGDMMRVWLAAQRRRKLVLNLPIPERIAAAFRRGGATAPDRAVGRVTWRAWLQGRYVRNNVAARHVTVT